MFELRKVGVYAADVLVKIHPIVNDNNDKPMLSVKIDNGSREVEYLCESVLVDDVEYVAQYNRHSWFLKHSFEDNGNLKVKLPSGDIISEEEFEERFGEKRELLL